MGKPKFISSVAALVAMSLLAFGAHAGILMTLDDDGFGNTAGTLVGSYDVSSGAFAGGGSSVDRFVVNGFPQIQISRRTTAATTGLFVNYAEDAPGNPGPILAGSFAVVASQLTVDDFLLNLAETGAAVVGYDGNNTGTLNESFSYAISFASFNTGIWNWGGGADNAGITLQIGAADAVTKLAEPSSLAMMGVALALAGFGRLPAADR